MMAPPPNIVLNPSGIGVEGTPGTSEGRQEKTEAKTPERPVAPTPPPVPSESDKPESEEEEVGDFSLPVEDAKPPSEEEQNEATATSRSSAKPKRKFSLPKNQILTAIAGLVLLAGTLAAADKFLFEGKLFGLGAKATGPYRYYPDSPQFILDLDVRETLFNPVVAMQLDEAGGMGMVDQMMQSAVGLGPYDIEEVKMVASDLSPLAPKFVCIVSTTKKIKEDLLVDKFFGNDKPESIGGRNVYDLPMNVLGGIVACVSDDKTFLLGDRNTIESVLSRKEDPVFKKSEMNLIESVGKNGALVSSSLDFELVETLGGFTSQGADPNRLVQDILIEPGSTRSARTLSIEAGIGTVGKGLGDALVFDYGLGFDSPTAADSALEVMQQYFDAMDDHEFALKMGIHDQKLLKGIRESITFTRRDSSVIMHMAIPFDFFTEMLMNVQGMPQM